MINHDFKFDLAEYLAQSENPPVRSLGEMLDRGLFHAALESTFRMRNAVEARDTEASPRARIKRTAIRHAVEAVLAEHRLTALIYPTIRRKTVCFCIYSALTKNTPPGCGTCPVAPVGVRLPVF
jgi:amidase